MLNINYDEKGLVPVIVQDAGTRKVLMLAYADSKAIEETLRTGYAHYYSRSRKKIWKKGEESGNIQEIVRILVDCDEDTVLYEVIQRGKGACHTGYENCFYRTIQGDIAAKKMFDPDSVYKNAE